MKFGILLILVLFAGIAIGEPISISVQSSGVRTFTNETQVNYDTIVTNVVTEKYQVLSVDADPWNEIEASPDFSTWTSIRLFDGYSYSDNVLMINPAGTNFFRSKALTDLVSTNANLPDLSALYAPGPCLYRFVLIGYRTDNLGTHPDIGLVFRTNVLRAKIRFYRAAQNDWNCETTVENTGAGLTNRIGYCCAPNPQALLLKVEVLQ